MQARSATAEATGNRPCNRRTYIWKYGSTHTYALFSTRPGGHISLSVCFSIFPYFSHLRTFSTPALSFLFLPPSFSLFSFCKIHAGEKHAYHMLLPCQTQPCPGRESAPMADTYQLPCIRTLAISSIQGCIPLSLILFQHSIS